MERRRRHRLFGILLILALIQQSSDRRYVEEPLIKESTQLLVGNHHTLTDNYDFLFVFSQNSKIVPISFNVTSNYTIERNDCHKVGNMVFLSVLITSSSNIANETVIATIPQGYRPSIARAVNMLDYNNDKPLSSELNTSGSVRVYYGGQSQTKKLYFSDAYVVE